MFIKEYDLVRLVGVNEFHYPVEEFTYPESITRMMNDVYDLHRKADEYLYVLGLDTAGHPSGIFMLAKGSPNAAYMNPNDLFTRLMLVGSGRFVMIHNHPGGRCKPSPQDIEMTKTIAYDSHMMGFTFMDHLIIASEKEYYSFLESYPEVLQVEENE